MPRVDPRAWRPDAFKIAFEALNVPGCRRFVAKIADEDVGFAAYLPTDNRLMSIASKYSGKGIGRALVAELLLLGQLWCTSEKSAEGFYEALGFTEDGKAEGKKVYRWV